MDVETKCKTIKYFLFIYHKQNRYGYYKVGNNFSLKKKKTNARIDPMAMEILRKENVH